MRPEELFLLEDFLPEDFFAEDFFAGDFAEDFFADDFFEPDLVEAFLVADLVEDFLLALFLPEEFFAEDFFAGDFFADDFLLLAFFVAIGCNLPSELEHQVHQLRCIASRRKDVYLWAADRAYGLLSAFADAMKAQPPLRQHTAQRAPEQAREVAGACGAVLRAAMRRR